MFFHVPFFCPPSNWTWPVRDHFFKQRIRWRNLFCLNLIQPVGSSSARRDHQIKTLWGFGCVSVPDVHKHNGSPHVGKLLSLSPIVAIFSSIHKLIVQRFPFQVSEKCTSNLLKIWDGCPWHVILFPGIPLISSWSPFTALIRPSI